MNLKINLDNFNIVSGKLEKDIDGHYTAEQYEQAKGNCEGINNAIKYAYENGYDGILLPYKSYISCDYKSSSLPGATHFEPSIVIPYDNFKIDLNSSTLDIIFDSTRKNPNISYGDSQQLFEYGGALFGFKECHNSLLTNGNLKGEWYNRTFLPNEEGQEQTHAIISVNAENCIVSKMSISGFARGYLDWGVRNTGYFDGGWKLSELNKGVLTDGASITKEGAYYTPLIHVNVDSILLFPYGYKNGLGNVTSYLGNTTNPLIKVLFFNSKSSDVLETRFVYAGINDIVHLHSNEDSVRLQFSDELDGDEDKILRIFVRPDIKQGITLDSCKIHNNHQLGVGGVGSNSIIINCKFWNNGKDCGIGAPVYPDLTKGHIDFESCMAENIRVIGNVFEDAPIDIIVVSTKKIEICNNKFISGGGTDIQGCEICNIYNNEYINTSPLGVTVKFDTSGYKGGKLLKRHISFYQNYVMSPSKNILLNLESVNSINRTIIDFRDNYLNIGTIQYSAPKDNFIRLHNNYIICNVLSIHRAYSKNESPIHLENNYIEYNNDYGSTYNDRSLACISNITNSVLKHIDNSNSLVGDNGSVYINTEFTGKVDPFYNLMYSVDSGILTSLYKGCTLDITSGVYWGDSTHRGNADEVRLKFVDCNIQFTPVTDIQKWISAKVVLEFINCTFTNNGDIEAPLLELYFDSANKNIEMHIKDCRAVNFNIERISNFAAYRNNDALVHNN